MIILANNAVCCIHHPLYVLCGLSSNISAFRIEVYQSSYRLSNVCVSVSIEFDLYMSIKQKLFLLKTLFSKG